MACLGSKIPMFQRAGMREGGPTPNIFGPSVYLPKDFKKLLEAHFKVLIVLV
jgi:hypothetical protein